MAVELTPIEQLQRLQEQVEKSGKLLEAAYSQIDEGVINSAEVKWTEDVTLFGNTVNGLLDQDYSLSIEKLGISPGIFALFNFIRTKDEYINALIQQNIQQPAAGQDAAQDNLLNLLKMQVVYRLREAPNYVLQYSARIPYIKKLMVEFNIQSSITGDSLPVLDPIPTKTPLGTPGTPGGPPGGTPGSTPGSTPPGTPRSSGGTSVAPSLLSQKGKELSAKLHKKQLFKTCPPVKRNPLMEGDACNDKGDWAMRGKYLKQNDYDCVISDVTFENDEDNFASKGTVDVMCEKAGLPTYVVRFKKLFQMKLQTAEKDAEMQKLLDLMDRLENISQFVKFVETTAKTPDKVKWCAVNAGAPAIPVISSVQAAGQKLTFVVTRSRDLASNETKRIVVESSKVRTSPNSQHIVIQTGPQAYSVFEIQPDMSKFKLSPVDLEQLQSIIKQNA
jgi:hypothetical protein